MPLSELQQVNAFVGLSIRMEGWPATLAELEYTLERIELKITKPDPKRPGMSITTNPDLLFVSDSRNCSLIIELKSGSNQGFEQLDRLVQLTAKDLVRYGRVTLQRPSRLASHQLSFMQVINREFQDQYLPEFERLKHSASLVTIDPESVRSRYGDLADKAADREFKRGISLAGCRIPTRLIPVLPTTAGEYELIESIVDGVKQKWISSVRSFEARDIGAVLFRGLWGRFDTEAQAHFLGKAGEILRDVSVSEFHDYLRQSPGSQQTWTLLRQPDTIDRKQLTKELQRFSRIAGEYKQRRLHNNPYPERHPDQMTFDDYSESHSDDSE